MSQDKKQASVKTPALYHVQNYSDLCNPEVVLKEIRPFYDGEAIQARDGDIFQARQRALND